MSIGKFDESFVNQCGDDIAWCIMDACLLGVVMFPLPRETLVDLAQQADGNVGEIKRAKVHFKRQLIFRITPGFTSFNDGSQMRENTPASALTNFTEIISVPAVRQWEEKNTKKFFLTTPKGGGGLSR